MVPSKLLEKYSVETHRGPIYINVYIDHVLLYRKANVFDVLLRIDGEQISEFVQALLAAHHTMVTTKAEEKARALVDKP